LAGFEIASFLVLKPRKLANFVLGMPFDRESWFGRRIGRRAARECPELFAHWFGLSGGWHWLKKDLSSAGPGF